ncbi:MAG: radical SAM protein [Treponema sp.]|nr:radical SAM protein [Treponema sp.]
MEDTRHLAVFTTLLVERSPQALPMGAACVASAVKSSPLTKNLVRTELLTLSMEDGILCALSDDKKAEMLAERILSEFPEVGCVCMSVYVWSKTILEKAALLLKEKKGGIVIVAGGPEITANPLGMKGVDFSVAGEGEVAVPELLHSIFSSSSSGLNESSFGILGVYSLRGSGGFVKGTSVGAKAIPAPLDELSSPWLDGTIRAGDYGGALWELARGCPFKCSYCYESKGYAKIRRFPQERLDAELELFAKEKIPQVFVLDPTYNADKKRALDMLRKIRRTCPETFFYFEARAEFIDAEIARAFASINCSVQFGLQSSDPAVLKNVNRSFNKNQFKKNVSLLNEQGVVFGFDLIYGLPGDSLSGFKDSIDFALGLYPNNLELFCLSVLPGTKLFEDAKSFGLEWQDFPPYHVLNSPSFPSGDLNKAERLSHAVNLFYTEGRAVPWFNAVVGLVREKPSVFFEGFAGFLENKQELRGLSDGLSLLQIEALQKEYVFLRLKSKGLQKYTALVGDIISLNGALSRCQGEGEECTLELSWHPDDLMSQYAADIPFFFANCGREKNRTHVFNGPNGPDWAVL